MYFSEVKSFYENVIITTPGEFFTSALADGLSLESE